MGLELTIARIAAARRRFGRWRRKVANQLEEVADHRLRGRPAAGALARDEPVSRARANQRGVALVTRDGERVIRRIQRVSRPGRRIYHRLPDVRPVLKGMGVTVLTTTRGVLSDREAREHRVGGEPLIEVW